MPSLNMKPSKVSCCSSDVIIQEKETEMQLLNFPEISTIIP